MNQSRFNSSYTAITTQEIVFIAFYSFIVFFGVLGNVLVIVIVRKTRSSHTPTDYLLTNLAVADLVTLLFCPGFYELPIDDLQLLDKVGFSFLKDIICKMFLGNAVVCIAFDASVINLCVIAVERFLAIVRPFNSDWNLTRRQAGLAVALIWVMAVTSSFPDILWTKYDNKATTLDLSARLYPCMRPWTVYHHSSNVKIYIIIHVVTLIIVPSIVISFSYISVFISIKRSPSAPASCEPSREQSSRRLLKLLISLAAAFCVLCLPFAGFFLYVASLDQRQLRHRSASLTLIHSIVRLLIFSNSFVNPLLYAAQSTNYRDTLQGLCCKINLHGDAVRETDVTIRTRRCEEADAVV